MINVIDKIFSYLEVGDIVKVSCVSREWRSMVKSNGPVNKERVRFIRLKKQVYERTKENHHYRLISEDQQHVGNKRRLSTMSASEKRIAYKSSRTIADMEESSKAVSNVFYSLDVNRLNNYQEPVSQHKRLLEQQFRVRLLWITVSQRNFVN